MEQKENFRKITLSGMIWKFLEQLGSKLIAFVVSVILARLLFPEDYGVIALTSIFITLCDTFVSSGFATSLIQKKDADELDYSSVFYTTLVIAIFLYLILFIFAPYIANWFDTPALCSVLRVLGVRIPIGAFGSVQQAYAQKNYLFKKFFIATTIGSVFAGVIGIVMAYNGFGVWALVAHDLIAIIINKISLYFVTKWRPHLCYSWARTKELFKFGWKVLASSLFTDAFNEVHSFVIGSEYTTEDLAYTSKGSSLPKMVGQFTSTPIRSVLMPVLSDKQDSKNMMHTISSCISCCCYIAFPIMCGLAIVAPTLVPLLYTEKWNNSIIFMQLMCIYFAIEPLTTVNIIMTQAKGNSQTYLITNIIARSFGIILLIICLRFGVFWIILSQVITMIFNFIILAICNSKIYGYRFWKQISDILPYILLTFVMGISIYFLKNIDINKYLILVIQVLGGVLIYFGLSILFKVPALRYLLDTMKQLFKNKKNE